MKFNFSSRAGGVQLGCIAVIAMVAMFWYGGQGLYTAFRNQTPTVMSYDDYLKKKPGAEWLRLTNCVLNLAKAAAEQNSRDHEISEVFIPVESPGENGPRVHVMLSSTAPEYIATAKEMMSLKTEAQALGWAVKNHARLLVHRDVEGIVRFGVKMNEHQRQELVGLKHNLDVNFIIIEDGQKPSATKSLALVGGGLLILLGGLALFFRSRKKA